MPFPPEAAQIDALPTTGWTEAEVRVARWVAEQQPGSAIGLLAVSPLVIKDLLLNGLAESRRPITVLPFSGGPVIPRTMALGMIVIDAAWWTLLATNAALDYYASRPQPGGILLWHLRNERARFHLDQLSRFFDVATVDGTRLAVLDLAQVNPNGPIESDEWRWTR